MFSYVALKLHHTFMCMRCIAQLGVKQVVHGRVPASSTKACTFCGARTCVCATYPSQRIRPRTLDQAVEVFTSQPIILWPIMRADSGR